MIKSFLFLSLSINLLFASGTYDGYAFTDEEEKYSLHFVNTSLSTEMTGIGLASADATAILGLRPITTLATVANNTNITGRDMLLIRSASYNVSIPSHSYIYDVNDSLGITNRDKNFLSSLSGVLFGFTFLFASVLLSIRR